MVHLSDLTPRELAVAALLGKRMTVKAIAATLDISQRRVYAIISAIAYKLHLGEEINDQLAVGDWWLSQVPIRLKTA